MNEVQRDILLVLLQVLLDHKRISQDVNEKARGRILTAENLPVFFCCGEEAADAGA